MNLGELTPVLFGRRTLERAVLATFDLHALSSAHLARGTGAGSYTRATTATIEDHESVVRYCLSGEARFKKSRRVRNLLTFTEDVSNAAWTKGTGASATNSQTITYNGSGSAGAFRLSQTAVLVPSSGRYFRVSVELRADTPVDVRLGDNIGTPVSITLTTSWVRYTTNAVQGNGVSNMEATIYSPAGVNTAFTIQCRKFQVEEVTGQSNQAPAAYVSVGAPKLNELIQTQNFDSASWTKTRSSITANAVAAPNGTLTADKLVEDTTVTNSHLVSMAGIPLDASVRELFVFAKQAERSALFIQLYDGTTTYSGNFNLATGSVGTTSNATSSITPLSDGWYRCAIVTNTPTAAASGSVTYSIQNPLGTNIYTGDGTSGLYLWEGGLRRIDVAGDYFSVGNAYPFHGAMVDGVKYFDDTNGNSVNSNVVTEAAGTPLPTAGRGYLPEDARTNLFVRASEYDNASWTKTDTTVTANATTAPDGTASADLLTEGAAGTALTSQAVTCTADVAHIESFYFKYVNTPWLRIVFGNGGNSVVGWFNIQTGVVGSVANNGTGANATINIEPAAFGFYRVWLTGSVGSGATAITGSFTSAAANGTAGRVNNAQYYVWGADFNNNTTIQRTHIPTAGSTVLQNADTLTYPAAGNAGVSGTLYAECGPSPVVNVSFQHLLCVSDGTASNFYNLQTNLANARAIMLVGGVNQGSASAVPWTNGTSAKIAARFGTNTIQFAKNGTLATEDTAASVPASVSIISIGTAYGGTGARANMPIQRAKIYNAKLFTDAQLRSAA